MGKQGLPVPAPLTTNALHGVDLTVREGEVVTLVGRNGAGKTTLLRCIMGLHRDIKGSITLAGEDITRTPPHRRARRGLGWVQDDRGIYASLNVEENLTLPPVTHRDTAWSLAQVYEAFPVLADRRRAPGTTLSGGEQQMLAIGRVLRTGATVLLMDEPSEGLAPVVVQRIRDIVLQVKERGTTVLLVEQNANVALQIAHRAYVMETGSIVLSGEGKALAQTDEVKRAYLGG